MYINTPTCSVIHGGKGEDVSNLCVGNKHKEDQNRKKSLDRHTKDVQTLANQMLNSHQMLGCLRTVERFHWEISSDKCFPRG